MSTRGPLDTLRASNFPVSKLPADVLEGLSHEEASVLASMKFRLSQTERFKDLSEVVEGREEVAADKGGLFW